MTVLAASGASASLYRLIDQAVASHEPLFIAGKRSSAMLVSEEDLKAIQETMHLLSIPGMRKSIRDAMGEPLATSARELCWGRSSTARQTDKDTRARGTAIAPALAPVRRRNNNDRIRTLNRRTA